MIGIQEINNKINKKNMKITNNFRGHQGDVQIFSIDDIPSNAIKVEKTFFAASEQSGHVHALTGDYELLTIPEGHVIKVGKEGAILNHTQLKNLTKDYWDKNEVTEIADHKPTHLKEGSYYIGIQQKFDPFAKVWKKVVD
jgi:hypothetical protein